ncbi:glycoside hydrolase family 57 protein [Cyclobacterium jeungdonense]|uniref:Glycoside hydrolase family 57 protein n=1 Tax=Cyclobacterium jeungdonense TaxID=708087 RepID=A0ABT8CCA8_9BACT|nr:glycoside hydrolase family 57 protein [Cyclobacterium jeungdonense]MDN3690155.1 glycoside hydrolase family 57 protein [Cyclobacterium jeungdonense]
MKNICLSFQVHQPFRLRKFPFFDIGEAVDYFDDAANTAVLKRVATKCYLPSNKLLLKLFQKHGKEFRVSFSISGTFLDQCEQYMPEVIESFKKLAETGNVEFLGETYAHSLSAMKSKEEFIRQVNAHAEKIESLFGERPIAFRNTELIYADFIGETVYEMGYKVMLTKGSDWVLGWKCPNYMYSNCANPNLRLLFKNYHLSDDISIRFSDRSWTEWPLTAEKFVHWLKAIPQEEEIVNLFMDYGTFGEHQDAKTGIFDFLGEFPEKVLKQENLKFITPSEAALLPNMGDFAIPYPLSLENEDRNLTAWLSNDMQQDALDTLYDLEDKVVNCQDTKLRKDWLYLQSIDHLYYMSTKGSSGSNLHTSFSPYNSPFAAFINYMNVLTDLSQKLDRVPNHRNFFGIQFI